MTPRPPRLCAAALGAPAPTILPIRPATAFVAEAVLLVLVGRVLEQVHRLDELEHERLDRRRRGEHHRREPPRVHELREQLGRRGGEAVEVERVDGLAQQRREALAHHRARELEQRDGHHLHHERLVVAQHQREQRRDDRRLAGAHDHLVDARLARRAAADELVDELGLLRAKEEVERVLERQEARGRTRRRRRRSPAPCSTARDDRVGERRRLHVAAARATRRIRRRAPATPASAVARSRPGCRSPSSGRFCGDRERAPRVADARREELDGGRRGGEASRSRPPSSDGLSQTRVSSPVCRRAERRASRRRGAPRCPRTARA